MPKKCKIEDCNNFVWGHGYCKYHQSHVVKSKVPKKDRNLFQREVLKKESLFEIDKQFYEKIWEDVPHRCFNCERQLPSEPLTLFFHHILPKRNYPELRHKAWNIMILCPDCHTQTEIFPDKTPKIKEYTETLLKKYENNQL